VLTAALLVTVCSSGVQMRLIGISRAMMSSRARVMMSRGLVVEGCACVVVRSCTTPLSCLPRFFGRPFVGVSALVRGTAARTGDLAQLLWIEIGEATSVTLLSHGCLLNCSFAAGFAARRHLQATYPKHRAATVSGETAPFRRNRRRDEARQPTESGWGVAPCQSAANYAVSDARPLWRVGARRETSSTVRQTSGLGKVPREVNMATLDNRRSFLTLAGASAALVACLPKASGAVASRTPSAEGASCPPATGDVDDVSAVEDLMREHGVIRRLLVVYREAANRLRVDRGSVPPSALHGAASLMQNFGEDYHERALEEAHIFPAVRKAGGPASGLIDTLAAQHQRGREITSYVLSVSSRGISAGTAEPLAHALEGFARMYEEHAAQEDTVVFQAWKKSQSMPQLLAAGELFEEIEHKTFGKDGFDDARDKIAFIEQELGMTLAGTLAPPPPPIL